MKQTNIHKHLVLVKNYVGNDSSNLNPISKPDISIFTPTPQHSKQKTDSSNWSLSNWFGLFSKCETEEDEFLDYMEYIEYFCQLGTETDDWDEEVYKEVFEDEEFGKYFKKQEDNKRTETLKEFEKWKSQKETIIKTKRWLNFKKGNYKTSSSFRKFRRGYAKKCFNQFIEEKKKLENIEKVIRKPAISSQNVTVMDYKTIKVNEALTEFKRIQYEFDKTRLKELLYNIVKEIPRLDLKSVVLPLQKSFISYHNNPEQLMSIIKKYNSSGLLKYAELENLKKCEVNAKNGYETHMEMIESYLNERECIASTVELRNGMNTELLEKFRLKHIDSE
ncbi:FF domain-containing protein [Entamoeba marina]